MAGRADDRLDRPEQEDEQRLREVMCEWRSVSICCDDSPHDEAIGPRLRPFHTASEVEFSEVRIRYVGLASYDSPGAGMRSSCCSRVKSSLTAHISATFPFARRNQWT